MKRTVKRHAVVQPLDQSIKLIPLTRGFNAIVSASDFYLLNQWHWFAIPSKKTETVYVGRMERKSDGTNRLVLMHRFVVGCEEDVDHIDRDGLNNTRDNLRPCSETLNAGNQRLHKSNKSGYKGVSWHIPTQKWICKIYFQNKQFHLGLFEDKIACARRYDRKALELFGEFARLNFPRSDY
jgi:hypothetical protein